MRGFEEPARGSESEVGLCALRRDEINILSTKNVGKTGWRVTVGKTWPQGQIVLRRSTRVSARWPGQKFRNPEVRENARVGFFGTRSKK